VFGRQCVPVEVVSKEHPHFTKDLDEVPDFKVVFGRGDVRVEDDLVHEADVFEAVEVVEPELVSGAEEEDVGDDGGFFETVGSVKNIISGVPFPVSTGMVLHN
jgi:hypothetical protein